MNAAALTTGYASGGVAKLYFFLMRILLSMLLLPIFFGFVIEAYNNNLPVVQQEQKARREAVHAELVELERAASIVGAPLPRERKSGRLSKEDSFSADFNSPHQPLLSPVGDRFQQQQQQPYSAVVPMSPLSVVSLPDTNGPAGEPPRMMLGEVGRQPSSDAIRTSHSLGGDNKRYVLKNKAKASDIHYSVFGPHTPQTDVAASGAGTTRSTNGSVISPGADVEAQHKAALEGLQSELEAQRARADRLEQQLLYLQRSRALERRASSGGAQE